LQEKCGLRGSSVNFDCSKKAYKRERAIKREIKGTAFETKYRDKTQKHQVPTQSKALGAQDLSSVKKTEHSRCRLVIFNDLKKGSQNGIRTLSF